MVFSGKSLKAGAKPGRSTPTTHALVMQVEIPILKKHHVGDLPQLNNLGKHSRTLKTTVEGGAVNADLDGVEADVNKNQPSNQTRPMHHTSGQLIPQTMSILDEDMGLPPALQPGCSNPTRSSEVFTMDAMHKQALQVQSLLPCNHSQITNDTATQPESDKDLAGLEIRPTSATHPPQSTVTPLDKCNMDTSTNIQQYPSHMETNTTEPENSAHASKSLSLGNPALRGCPPSSSPSLGQPANPTQPEHSHSDGDNHANSRNLDCGSGAAILSDDQVALGLTAGIEDRSSQPNSPLQSNTHACLRGKIDALRNACSGSMRTYQALHSYVGLQSDRAGSSQYRNPVPPASSQPSTSIRASQLPRRRPHIPGGVGGGAQGRSLGTRVHDVARHTGCIHLGQPAQPMHELFPDHEEELLHAKAIRFGAWPDSIRKPKPHVNDYFGTEHHVLTLAKVHLYAVALVEDPYMTRGLAMLTASVVHEDTWLADLSGVAYSPATCEQCEILMNSLATNRGKTRDSIQNSIEAGFGFIRAADTEEDFLQNEDLFELVKDSFYCISFDPPEGHYESREIHHAIGAGLFNGPNSVGILYQDYFNPMPLAVVAFVIAVMEFCIEEWSSGFFEHADLDTKNMSEKYRFHLSELEAL